MTIEIPDNEPAVHEEMFNWAQDLFPICRSITGDGVRETTAYLRKILPSLQVHEVPTGTECFDWKIPDEWTIRDAYIADTSGSRIVDFKKNNLSVVNYSISVRYPTYLPTISRVGDFVYPIGSVDHWDPAHIK